MAAACSWGQKSREGRGESRKRIEAESKVTVRVISGDVGKSNVLPTLTNALTMAKYAITQLILGTTCFVFYMIIILEGSFLSKAMLYWRGIVPTTYPKLNLIRGPLLISQHDYHPLTSDLVKGLAKSTEILYNIPAFQVRLVARRLPGCTAWQQTPSDENLRWNSKVKRRLQSFEAP